MVTTKYLIRGDEMASDDDDDKDNFMETVVVANSVGKSEVELRAQRADIFDGLVTALAVDVAKELTVLSAMDIEPVDPAGHVEAMTALLEADELVTHLLLAIDKIKWQVAKTPKTGRRTEKEKKRRFI
jgi:hypothetical protein